MQASLIAINSKYIHTGLGLRYVGEYARQQGHDIKLIEETTNTPILTVLEKIMDEKSRVFAFSVHIWNKPFVFRLIGMLKKLRPDALVVVGGPEVAFDAERIFMEQPAIDYIVQGEGEICFTELLSAIETDCRTVPLHIAYMENGSVKLNGGTTVIEDMKILPFPYPDLEQVLAEHKIVYYECTRGCPFNCSYCLSGISRSVRKRPLELVMADLNRFVAAGADLVKFVDRTYNLDEKYFLPIMKYLAELDTKATFHFEIKADMLSDTVLDFLQNVPKGRFQMEIGIQSTNQPTLTAINRQDNWKRLEANVKRLLSFKNIHIHVDLIAGLPFEGLKEFAKSFNDVYGLGADMLQLGFLKVLPGTQMNNETKEHDLRYMDEPPYEILATKYMPYKDMQLLKRLENVFDQTGNTDYFVYTLKALLRESGKDAFTFFVGLTEWWVRNGHYPQGHNAKGTAKLLYDYINDTFAEEQKKILIETLRYDVFTKIAGWKPVWLKWNSEEIFDITSTFWRDEARVRKILPQYKFASWRAIHKSYPIELFNINWETGEVGQYYIMVDWGTSDGNILPITLE